MSVICERPIAWRRPEKDRMRNGTKRRTWISRCGRVRREELQHAAGNTTWVACVRDLDEWRLLAHVVSQAESRHAFNEFLSRERTVACD